MKMKRMKKMMIKNEEVKENGLFEIERMYAVEILDNRKVLESGLDRKRMRKKTSRECEFDCWTVGKTECRCKDCKDCKDRSD